MEAIPLCRMRNTISPVIDLVAGVSGIAARTLDGFRKQTPFWTVAVPDLTATFSV